VLTVRLSPRELDVLRRGAVAAGTSVAELLRHAATDAARSRLAEARLLLQRDQPAS
jgi:hypothetical protein